MNYVVGSGSFGLVWAATCIKGEFSGTQVAIKVIDLATFEEDTLNDIKHEIHIMAEAHHKNIIGEFISFVDKSNLLLIMPICDAGSC